MDKGFKWNQYFPAHYCRSYSLMCKLCMSVTRMLMAYTVISGRKSWVRLLSCVWYMYMFVWMCVGGCVCLCMQRPDANISVLFLFPSALIFETGSLSNAPHCLSWLGSESQGLACPHLPSPYVNVFTILNQNYLKTSSCTSSDPASELVWCGWLWQLILHLCGHCWDDLGHWSTIDYYVC